MSSIMFFSTVSVIVKGLDGPPFGILEIDNTTQREYGPHDINFLTGFANVIAEAVATAGRVASCLCHMQMQKMVDERTSCLLIKARWPRNCSIGCAIICNWFPVC